MRPGHQGMMPDVPPGETPGLPGVMLGLGSDVGPPGVCRRVCAAGCVPPGVAAAGITPPEALPPEERRRKNAAGSAAAGRTPAGYPP